MIRLIGILGVLIVMVPAIVIFARRGSGVRRFYLFTGIGSYCVPIGLTMIGYGFQIYTLYKIAVIVGFALLLVWVLLTCFYFISGLRK